MIRDQKSSASRRIKNQNMSRVDQSRGKPEEVGSRSVTVKARYLRISAQKLNLVAKILRRRRLAEAEEVLAYSSQKAAGMMKQLLKSAQAAAKEKGLDLRRLVLTSIWVEQGPSFKRARPVARGTSHPIRKKTAHVSLTLEENYGTES